MTPPYLAVVDAGADDVSTAASLLPTSLALSSRIEFSPRGGAMRFAHAAAPVTHDDRTELWNTRLARARADGSLFEGTTDLIALRSNTSGETTTDPWKADVQSSKLSALSIADAAAVAKLGRDKTTNFSAPRLLRTRFVQMTPLGASMDGAATGRCPPA